MTCIWHFSCKWSILDLGDFIACLSIEKSRRKKETKRKKIYWWKKEPEMIERSAVDDILYHSTPPKDDQIEQSLLPHTISLELFCLESASTCHYNIPRFFGAYPYEHNFTRWKQ